VIISLMRFAASPSFVMHADADGTSMPTAEPSFCFVGTNV